MTAPTWATAGEVKPAPGALLLVQSFVNTADFDLGTDVLADSDTESAQRWLTAAGLQGSEVTATPAELHLARDVRVELRLLLLANAGAPLPAMEELPALRAVISSARIGLALNPDGSIGLTAEPGRRLPEGLLGLLMIIRDAQHDGTWARLKACGNDECRWVFYDRSHSRQGTWCDMSACGNVIKNRNLRARRGSSARHAAARP
jgi:predicted RNA-binding Zn ribbon-like protein